jgi:hypothetical protein
MGQLNGCETSLFPNGNIAISTFVKLDTSTEGYCLAAGSGDPAFGVAGPETHTMSITIQGTNLDDGFAGVAGGPAIKIYGAGATMIPLRVAAATNIGDRLAPDANGYGAVTTSDKIKGLIAVARQSGAANAIVNVDLHKFDTSV